MTTSNSSRRRGCPGLAIVLALLVSGCGGIGAPSLLTDIPFSDHAVTRHVIVVSIDGLGAEMAAASGARTLARLRAEGAYARDARTILPSLTLPSHTSMLTGVDVDKHGITWNTDMTASRGVVSVPTMLEIANDAGLVTAFFTGKQKLKHLLRPGSLDYAVYPRTDSYYLADRVAQNVVQYLRFRRPNLLFIHLPDPDLAGHAFGWGDLAYRTAVRRADAAVERIHRSARRAFGDDFVMIVTADHGGDDHTHGEDLDAHTRIPWIAWGESVSPGEIEEGIRTYDTAATALWLLGLPVPEGWDGVPVKEAFITTDGVELAQPDSVGPRATPDSVVVRPSTTP